MALHKISFFSQEMIGNREFNVIIPNEIEDIKNARVMLLLHGMSGNQDDWIRYTRIECYADKYKTIIITPNGANGFYTDTALEKYYTHVAHEVPEYCAKVFGFSQARENNCIAGLSMGGFGAMKIALNNPERFYAACSLSGVLDLETLSKGRNTTDEDYNTLLFVNTFGKELDYTKTNSDMAVLLRNVKNPPKLYVRCGANDFLYEANKVFLKNAEKCGVAVDFEESQGEHTWDYWETHIQGFLRFATHV